MMKTLKILGISALGLSTASAATTVNTGSIVEFGGPDDLLLDPATAVIAVDSFGNGDSNINGVTFSTDRAGLGANVVSEGLVTVGAVSVRTAATNSIDNWANNVGVDPDGIPGFTGGTAGSAANLANVMRDIRFSGAPNSVFIDVTGLNSNSLYHVQLLFNEGQNTNDRRHDIGVNGALVVDDFSSHGGVFGSWTDSNSFAYQGVFDSGVSGAINIDLNENIGGIGPQATDHNPIIQGIIVHEVIPEPSAFLLFGLGIVALAGRRRRPTR